MQADFHPCPEVATPAAVVGTWTDTCIYEHNSRFQRAEKTIPRSGELLAKCHSMVPGKTGSFPPVCGEKNGPRETLLKAVGEFS